MPRSAAVVGTKQLTIAGDHSQHSAGEPSRMERRLGTAPMQSIASGARGRGDGG
jgi:hypothetical protein